MYAVNAGPALSPARVSLGSKTITLSNNPRSGGLDIESGQNAVNVSGYVYDPNAPAQPVTVNLLVDGKKVASGPTNLASVAFNQQHGITGKHAFDFTAALSVGTHTVALQYVNIGAGSTVTTHDYKVTITGVTPAPSPTSSSPAPSTSPSPSASSAISP